MALDTLADDIHCFQAHEFQVAYALLAEDGQELLQTMANAADQLPAVASAGTPADLARFQQNDGQTTLGQLNGSIEARIAAADDAHISAVLTFERRVVGVRHAAGGVIRGGVLRAVDHLSFPGAKAKGRG